MSIAIDLPRKRIYIRGDIYKAYRWIKLRFAEMSRAMPFELAGEQLLVVERDWTVEHNPEPLTRLVQSAPKDSKKFTRDECRDVIDSVLERREEAND